MKVNSIIVVTSGSLRCGSAQKVGTAKLLQNEGLFVFFELDSVWDV